MEYDLEERAIKFSENIITLVKYVELNEINKSTYKLCYQRWGELL